MTTPDLPAAFARVFGVAHTDAPRIGPPAADEGPAPDLYVPEADVEHMQHAYDEWAEATL